MENALGWLFTLPFLLTCLMTLTLLIIYLIRWRAPVAVQELPSVSVFIPYYNENADILIASLNKLEQQQYPTQLQIIIIDDGSNNNTPMRVKEWVASERKQQFVILTRQSNEGRKGFALDFALDSGVATGDAYVIVDSDTYVEPDGIAELVAKLWSHPDNAAVCGYVVPENYRDSLIGKLQYYEHIGIYGAIRAAQDLMGTVPVLAGAFVAHRASVVREIGGWSEWLVEDISWSWKALAHQYRTGYAANAVATTQCPISHNALFKQRRRWARGRVEAYVEAWKVSFLSGVKSTPWFLMTAMNFIFPPKLIMLPVLMMFQVWLPVLLSILTLCLYLVFTALYFRRHGNKTNITKRDVANVPFYASMLDAITWLPNVLGYVDEFRGKKKNWLTR
ncbi:glycosyltransferase [Motilimonas cestriensis]|uniref:Glycosyltransferase n=1 Tax=Motilimonas cestriensis TaxID=2742685 RepID=A0ABS8WFI1_9GAMM|nr:glycosyltransferase family 2 protein [Motilimonas cestriensis]MCE2597053.1 glycosyltransferase [Motilimonas cestriensis]